MKILLVIYSLGIGGEQRAASILTKYFTKKNIEVDVLTFNILENIIDMPSNINIFQVNNKSNIPFLKNIKRIYSIRKHIVKYKYNLVIGFAIIPSILSVIASLGLKTKVIVTERSDPSIYNKMFKIMRAIFYRYADGAIFQTTESQQYFSTFKNLDSKVIPNPIDSTIIPEYYTGQRTKRIVAVGRLIDVKNHQLLIRAFSHINLKYPEYKLSIYGEGGLEESLKKQIEELNLKNTVELEGISHNVLKDIQKDQLFVLTSKYEGYPNSLAEAMALGLPVISTDCRVGGPRDLINDGNGILIRENNLNDLVEAIDKVLGNLEIAEEMGKKALKVKRRLDGKIIAQQWIDYFEYVIKKEGCGY